MQARAGVHRTDTQLAGSFLSLTSLLSLWFFLMPLPSPPVSSAPWPRTDQPSIQKAKPVLLPPGLVTTRLTLVTSAWLCWAPSRAAIGEELCPPVDPGLPLTCLLCLRTAAHWAVQTLSSRAGAAVGPQGRQAGGHLGLQCLAL